MTTAWHRHTLDPVHTVYPSATPYDTPERTALVQTVRAFAMDDVLPVANELDPQQQRSWRAFLVGTTLLMDRLDRELREQHRISLP